jgi:hypothetical protein
MSNAPRSSASAPGLVTTCRPVAAAGYPHPYLAAPRNASSPASPYVGAPLTGYTRPYR